MTPYLDASVLVAAIVREPFTFHAQTLMRDAEMLYASEWVLTEVVSGLAIKKRTGQLTADQCSLAQGVAEEALEGMTLLEIQHAIFVMRLVSLDVARCPCAAVMRCISPSLNRRRRCCGRLIASSLRQDRRSASTCACSPDYASMLVPSAAWTSPPSTVIVSPTT